MGFAETYLNWNRGGREMAEAQQRARQEQLQRQEEERRRQEQEAAKAQAAAEQRAAYEAELQRRQEQAARDLEAQDRHKKKDNENIKADRYQKVFSEYNSEDPYDPKNALLWKAWNDYGYNDNEDIEDAYNVAVRRNQTIQDEYTADYIRYRQQADYAAAEPHGVYATDQEKQMMKEYGFDYQTAKAIVELGKKKNVEDVEEYKKNMMQYGIYDEWLDTLDSENATIDHVASRELESRKAYGLSQGKPSELDGADPIAARLAKENPTLTYQEAKEIVKGARWLSDNFNNYYSGDEDSVYQRANEWAQGKVSKRAERIVNQKEATEEFGYGFFGEGNLQGMAQEAFRERVGAEANPETGEYEYGGNLGMQLVDFTVGTLAGLPYGITSVVKQPRKMLSDIEMGGTLQEDENGELARKAYTGYVDEAAEVGDLLLNFVDDLPGLKAAGTGAKIVTSVGQSALKRFGGVLSTSARAGLTEAPIEATQGVLQDTYEGRETDWKNIGEQALGGFIGGSAMGVGGAAAGAAGKAAAKPLAKAGEAIKAVGSEVAAGFSEAVNKVPVKPVKTTANAADASRIASIVNSVKPQTIEEVNEVASMLSEELDRKVSTTEVWAAIKDDSFEVEELYRKRSIYDENPEEFVQKQEAEAEAAAKAEQEAAAKAEAEAKKTAPKKEKVVIEPADITNVGEDIVGENASQAVKGKVTGKKVVKRLTEDGKKQPLTLEERAEQASIEDIKQASIKLKNIVSGKDTTFAITREQRERYEALLDGGIAENGKEIYIEVENYNASRPAIKGYKKSNGRFDGKSETAEQKAKRLANTNEAFSAVEGKVSDRVPEGSKIAIIGSKKYKMANMSINDGGIASTLNHLGIAKPSVINTVDNTGVSASVSALVTKNFPDSTLNNFKQNEKAHGKSAIYKATDRAVKNADALIVYWDGDETTEGNKATKAAMDRASVNGIPVFAVNSRGEVAEYHYDGSYVQPEGGTKRSRIIEKGAEMYAALKANDASAYAKAESELMEIISGNAAYVAKSGMGSTYTNNSRYNISEAVSDIKKDWLEYIRKRINSYKGEDNARAFGEYLYGGQRSGLIWAMNHPSHTVAVLEKLGFEKKPSTVNSKATLLSAFGDDPQISSKNELIDASVAEASRAAGSYGNYLLSQKDEVAHSSKAGKVTQQNLIEVTADSKKIMKARAMLANGIRNMKQFRAYISLLFESEEDIQLMLDIAQSRKETVAVLRADYASLANNKAMKEEIISALDEGGGDARAIRDYYISLGDTDLVGREVVEDANGKEVIEDNIKADAAAIKAAINDPKAVEVNYLDVLAESIMKTKDAKMNIGDVRKMAATIFMKFHDKRGGWSEQRKNDIINAIINYILERRSKGHPDYSVYKGVDYTEKYFTTAVNTIDSINKKAKADANKKEPYISEVGKVLNSLIETDDYRQIAAEASSRNQLISTSGPSMFEQVEDVANKYDEIWDDLSEEEKMNLLIEEQGLSSMTNNDAENLDMYDNAGYMLQEYGYEYRKSGKKSSAKNVAKSIPRGIGYVLGKFYTRLRHEIEDTMDDIDKLKHDTYKRKLIAKQVAAMELEWFRDSDNPEVKTRLMDLETIKISPYLVKPKGITGATKNIIRILQEEYGVPVFYTTSRMLRRGHEAGVFRNPNINGLFTYIKEDGDISGQLVINIDKESNASTLKSLGDMLMAMGPKSEHSTIMSTVVHEAAHLAQKKALVKIDELANKIENEVVAATYKDRMIADYVTGIDENNYDEMMRLIEEAYDKNTHEPAAYATEDLIKRYSAGEDYVFHGDEFLEVYEKSKGFDEKNIDGSEITASPIQAAAQLIMNIGDRNKHRVLPEGVKFDTLEEARTAALVKGYGGFGSIAAKFMNWWNRYHDSTLVVGLSKTDLEDRFNPLKNIERVTNLLVRHLSDTTYMLDPTVIEQLMYKKKYLLNAKRGESFSLRTAVNNLARVDIILAGYLKTAGMAKLINKVKLDPEFSKRCGDYMWARYLLADRELGIKKINFLMPGTKTMEESFARAEEVVAAMDPDEALMIDTARLKINNLNLELAWKTGQINPERYNEILDINEKGKYFIPLRRPSVAGDGNKFVGSTMDKTNVANQGLINEMPDTTAKEGEEIQYTRAEDFLHPLTALADATYEGCVKSGSNQILVDIANQWKIITETPFFNVKSRDGATLKTSGKNTIEFDHAGEKFVMEVPTFISDTINNEFLPITHKLLTVPAQLVRIGSTGMNIEFIVGLNMVRDFISSSLFTPDGHKLWMHLPKAMATLVFASKERSKLVSLGAISDSFNLVTVSRNQYGEVKKERVDVTPQKAEAIRQGFRFLWSGMNFFENITRVANFYNALDHGQKRNYDDPLGYAVYVAQHGSGNFHNVGDCKMMRANAQLTPYSQSSIAGAAGAREMFWMNPVQSMLRSLTFVGAVAMTNAMSVGMLGYPGEDDEDREKRAEIFGNISSGDKEQNIILPLPGAEFILIPAPQSMYALLKLINDNKGPGRTQEEGSWAAESVLYAIAGISGLNITGNNWWQMVSGLANYIPLVGTFVKPGLEIWAGKSFFTGRSLRSDDEQALIGTSQEWSIGEQDTKPWIKTISTALHDVGFNHVVFSPSGIETLIANSFGTWGRRYVTNQALPINPLAVYKINKNTDLRTYEEKAYDYTKFENAIVKKFGISGSDSEGKLARAKTTYNAGQKLASVAEDLVYGDRVRFSEADWVALRQYVSGLSDASGEEADAVQDRAMVLAYQIMNARLNDTSEDINTDLYFETNAELYAAPMETQQAYFTTLFAAGQMFNQPRAMAKAILGLSAEWEDMSVEERVSKGRLVATDMNAVEGFNDAIIDGGAETKEDYARILFSGYTGKKISDRQLIILASMQETPNGRIGDCGFNMDLWITQEELSEMKKADEYVVSYTEYNARATAFYEKLIDAHETFDVEGLDKGWDDLSTTESILYRGTVAALNESLMVDKETQKYYETMGLEAWRDNYLGKNGEEAEELARVLKALDDVRAAAGVSLNTTDHSKNKYYLKESSGGTGRYGGGGGGSQHMLSLTELRAAMKQYFPKGNSVSTGMTVDTKGTRAITPATKGKNYSSGELIMPTSYTPTNKNVVKYKRSKTRQGNMGQSYMDFLSGTNKSQGNFRAARKYE